MLKYAALLGMLFIGLIGGYNLVFGGNIIFAPEIKYAGTLSDEIYLGNQDLDNTVIIFKSNVDISSAQLKSNCSVDVKYITSQQDLYFFDVDYGQNTVCKNGNFVLRLGENIIANAAGKLNIFSKNEVMFEMLDISNDDLKIMKGSLEENISKNAIYKNYTGKDLVKYFTLARGQREYQRDTFIKEIIEGVISARQKKYSSPVPGYSISEKANKIPNTGRPYRAGYTDGVHRGWDIDAPFRSDVAALDDGFIVRVVESFSDADFSRIVYGDNLSVEQQLKNLDILRGKQVWMKTMKGEVVFYSHLDEVEPNISEGMFVSRGEKLGKTGVSGVPEDGYNDYHLHFAIMQNPYIPEMIGKYDFGDYMSWDWLTKGMNHDETVNMQKQIFE